MTKEKFNGSTIIIKWWDKKIEIQTYCLNPFLIA